MIRRVGFSCAVLTLTWFAAGCGGGGGGGGQNNSQDAGDAGSDAPADASDAGDASDATSSDAGGDGSAAAFGFQPSNLPADFPTFDGGDVVMTGKNCAVVTDPKSSLGLVCAPNSSYTTQVVKQANGPDLMVFAMKSLTVAKDAEVYFDGPLPAVFVVSGKVKIEGLVQTSPSAFMNKASGGGAEGTGPFADGLGAGAGLKADTATKLGGAGGSFCGLGGGSNVGKTYGSPDCIPLLGGSSGGGGYGLSGAGGGALQIVATEAIEIAANGIVNFGGGGGTFGSGGGSGGAILFEAPLISIAGILAANGGGGAGNGLEQKAGERGQASSVAALGGQDGKNPGGSGSAGGDLAGKSGTYDGSVSSGIPDHGGGSGAGAGRIRLNSSSGSATVTGTISPALSSACATEGVLTKP